MRFRTIDGLRGIAALSVVLFHLNGAVHLTFGDYLPGIVDWIFRHGYLGVDVFFVISGFVIAYNIRSADPTLGYLGRFAVRRMVRLDPPYWTAVVLETAMLWIGLSLAMSTEPLPTLKRFFSHFLYLQNILGHGDIVNIFWTLCFEIQFYIALISLAVLGKYLASWVGSAPAKRIAVIGLGCLFTYSVLERFQVFGLEAIPGLATLRWYEFSMGSCVWWVVSKRLPFLALAASWLLLSLVVVAQSEPLYELLPIAVTALIWWSHERDRMASVLSGRAVQFLGTISYSLYLFHTTIGWRFTRLVGSGFDEAAPRVVALAVLVAGIGVSIAAAYAAWYVLERPSVRWSKRIALSRLPDSRSPG